MKFPQWSAAELELLEQVAIDQPPDRILITYNNCAKQQGFPARTKQAVTWRMSQLGLTEKACGDWVSAAYICRVLGVSTFTPHYWTDRKGIPCHRDGRGRRYFRRSELRKVARQQPDIFGGISADRLFMLLEDRQLADDIAAQFPRRGSDPKPVVAVETGWWYPSITAAAERNFIGTSAIQQAVRTGCRAAGYHWRLA